MMRGTATWVLLASIALPLGGGAHRRTEEGNRHYEAEEYDDALRAYTEAQVHSPDAPELFYDIGNVLYRQGDYAGAEEAYQRALRSAPGALLPKVAYNLGNARYRQRAYQEAVEAYRRALEAAPDDVDAKRNLELALRQLESKQQPQQAPQQPGEQDRSQEPDESGGGAPQTPESPPDDRREPQPREEGEQGQQQREPPPPSPSEMTAEQAERLLNGLQDQERENLRKHALDRAGQDRTEVEEDW